VTPASKGGAARAHLYTVDDYAPTLSGVRYTLATDSEADPCICVHESDDGRRSYQYAQLPPTMPATVDPTHRRRAAAAIRRYHRSGS
jgi:hypothetical protein